MIGKPGKVGRSIPSSERFTETNDRSVKNAPRGAQVILNSFGDKSLIIFMMFVVGVALIVSILAWGDASRAAAKAETATARANVSELYAKQLFTEMNRLGYPIRTPAEQHDPQPPDVAIPEDR